MGIAGILKGYISKYKDYLRKQWENNFANYISTEENREIHLYYS